MIRKPWFGVLTVSFGLLGVALVPRTATAQDEKKGLSRFSYAVVRTLADPTTYAPALFGFDATMRDWRTSQVLFRQGFVEKNERFTVSGLPYDRPVSYEAGRNQILRDALSVLEVSALQNVSAHLIEHALTQRYPRHRRMVQAIGWIERAAVASAMSYYVAADHYRQSRRNEEVAAQFGFR